MDNVTSQRNVTHSKEKDITDGDVTQSNRQHNMLSSVDDDTSKRKKSSVNHPTTNPNTTTWQQQSMNFQQMDNDGEFNSYRSIVLFNFNLKITFQLTKIALILTTPNYQLFA